MATSAFQPGGPSAPLFSRRALILGASSLALLASWPAAAAAPVGNAEKTIAKMINSAAIRQKFTPKESWDLATKLGVSLGSKAPRATPWMKLIARASPVGRVITIISTLALAYDFASDLFSAAPRTTKTGNMWDGDNPNCQLNQVCSFKDSSGNSYLVTVTMEKSASASNWTYAGRPGYSSLKQLSLGTSAKPYVYQVWWRAPITDLYKLTNPVKDPADANDKKVTIAPGDLAEYLKQFADERPDLVGLSQSVNDLIEQLEKTDSTVKTGLHTTATDALEATTGVGTKVRDFLDDTAFDRDPQVAVDPQTGVPIPDPEATPGTQPSPSPSPSPSPTTGTQPGGSIFPPGWFDSPPTAEPPKEPGDFPMPTVPAQTPFGLSAVECPVRPEGTFKGQHIRVDAFCDYTTAIRTRIGSVFRLCYAAMAASVIWRG